MLAQHTWGFIVRLRDGRVMVGGGDGGVHRTCELFDATTNKFTTAGALNQGRSMLTAHTLPDGARHGPRRLEASAPGVSTSR